jgi:ADP-ribosylation factor-like protein 2
MPLSNGHGQRLAGATLLVFANKQDLQGSMTSPEIRDVSHHSVLIVDQERFTDCSSQILDLPSIRSHTWKIIPCSAVTGANLVEGLDWIVSDVAKRLYYSTTVSVSHEAPRVAEPGPSLSVMTVSTG